MAYTRHGHHIRSTARANYEALLDKLDCGGPDGCVQCKKDVARYFQTIGTS